VQHLSSPLKALVGLLVVGDFLVGSLLGRNDGVAVGAAIGTGAGDTGPGAFVG